MDIDIAKKQIKKRYGDEAIIALTDRALSKVQPVCSTGLLGLDHNVIGIGGYPKDRIVEVYGPESCVGGESFIQYEVRRKDGNRINHKGGTIQRLWERFHGKPATGNGRGKYLRPQNIGAEFYAPSVNEEGRIFQNKITDVVKTGKKECFEITTLGGLSLFATNEHRFFDGLTYHRLDKLDVGKSVMVHTSTPFTKEHTPKRIDRIYLYVNFHPIAGSKTVRPRISRTEEIYGEYEYKRVLRSRAVVEANMNGLNLDEYVERLNAGDLTGLNFLCRNDHVHHLDDDCTNDDLKNLVVISSLEHGRLHSMDRHNNLRYVVTEDVISSIVPVGEIETFDLKMESPFNNYVVEGFVTHNSGKTTLALHGARQMQLVGGDVVYVDVEHALDPLYAENGIGVDMRHNILFSQPDYGEQALEIIVDLLKLQKSNPERPAMFIVDSVDALIPKKELEGDIDVHETVITDENGKETKTKGKGGGLGLRARLMSDICRKITAHLKGSNSVVIFINQIRMKIGVMFGSPETTSGGNALKFYAAVRLDIRNLGKAEIGALSGNYFKITARKNKVSPPWGVYEGLNLHGMGFQGEWDIFTMLKKKELIATAGSWSTYKPTDIKFQGYAGFRKMLKDDQEFRRQAEQLAIAD